MKLALSAVNGRKASSFTKNVLLLFVLIFAFVSEGYAQSFTFVSKASGQWTNQNTWDRIPAGTNQPRTPRPQDNAIISAGHTVTFVGNASGNVEITDLTIQEGGVIDDKGLRSVVSGNLIIDGSYFGSGIIELTGNGTSISGTGTISNEGVFSITGDKTILTAANLVKVGGDMVISGAYTITNNGTFSLAGNLLGSVPASTWTNAANSTLNIGGSPASPTAPDNIPLLLVGTLNAFASGNTVNYYSSVDIALKTPSVDPILGLPAYHHLTISGSNTKTLPNAEISINGDLTLNSNLNADAFDKIVHLRGNWINNSGQFTEGFGMVIFDGSSDQTISCNACGGTETFNHFTVNKESGSVKLNTNVKVGSSDNINSILTMIQGNIETGIYKITLGRLGTVDFYNGSLAWTSGTIVGSFERGIRSFSSIPNGEVFFPVGALVNGTVVHRPLLVKLNSLTVATGVRSLTVQFSSNYPGNGGLPIEDTSTNPTVFVRNTIRDGYWVLSRGAGITSASYDLSVTGNGFSGFDITTETRLLYRPSSSTNWVLQGIHGINTGTTVRRTGMSVLPTSTGDAVHFALGDVTDCEAPVTSLISGDPDVCKGDAGIVYSVVVDEELSNPSTYSWVVTGGTLVSGNGTDAITVNWDNVGQVGSVSALESNSCTQGETKLVSVNVGAVPPTEIIGSISVAANATNAEQYSILSAGDQYMYTWSVNSNGTFEGGINEGETVSIIWGDAGTSTLTVTATLTGCESSSLQQSISIFQTIKSTKNGTWKNIDNATNRSLWDCNCIPNANNNLIIRNPHVVTIDIASNQARVRNIVIEGGATLNTGSTSRSLTVTGKLTVYGILGGPSNVFLNGGVDANEALVDGTGVISNTGTLTFNAFRTIAPTAILSKSAGNVVIANNVTARNEGSFTVAGNLSGNASATWDNDPNSLLEVGGVLLTNGKLVASDVNNTVRYTGILDQTLKIPESEQYFNLELAGSSTAVKNQLTDSRLKVAGNFTNNAVYAMNGGILEFNGTQPQAISGSSVTDFGNIELASSSNVTVESNQNLTGILTLGTNAIFDADGGNNTSVFTIKSLNDRPTQDGSIGVIGAGGSVTGNVTAERYISAQGLINRYISSPLASIPVSQLQDDFTITGPFTGSSFPCIGCKSNAHSFKFYNESVAGNLSRGYEGYPVASGSNTATLQTGRGYLAYMYENNTFTWDMRGPLNQGVISLPVTFTATSGGIINDGWNLVGNPYPSSIIWGGDLDWERTNIDPVISVPDLSITTGYPNYFQDYNWVDNSGDPNAGIIAMGQAFWVKANGPNPSLTVRETAKTGSGSGNFYRTASPSEQLVISINNGQYEDRSYLKLNPEATESFDNLFDGYKLKNEFMNVYLIDEDDRDLVMHTVREINRENIFPIGIDVASPGTYTLRFDNLSNFSAGHKLYFIDADEDVVEPLTNLKDYSFTITDIQQPITDRFYLSLNGTSEGLLKEQISLYPNPVKQKLNVRVRGIKEPMHFVLFDFSGKEVQKGIIDGDSMFEMHNYPAGLYILQINTSKGVLVKKIIKSD